MAARQRDVRASIPWRRRVLHVVTTGLLLAGIVASALAASVMWPVTDHAGHADALVVLSGDHGERLARAKQLLAAGVAPVLVLVGTPDSVENLDMCQGDSKYTVVCLRPDPDSTRAEAAATAQLARSRHWKTLTVVTSTPHVSRTRLLFSRCWSGSLDVVGADLRYGGGAARQARVHEWVGLVYALTALRC
jgi:uncharacterized SAM-binding protein YcdF (DUF218 family)